MILTDPSQVDPAELKARTGWELKPEGACKGDACIPLPTPPTPDAATLAERLGMPLVHDERHGLYALGPETAVTGRALTTAELSAITLPDLDGTPHPLHAAGRKTLIVAWASW
jgi:hypothetical protein